MSADSTTGPADTSGSGDGAGGSGGSVDPVGSLSSDTGPGVGARLAAGAGWVMRTGLHAARMLAHHQNDHVNRKAESG